MRKLGGLGDQVVTGIFSTTALMLPTTQTLPYTSMAGGTAISVTSPISISQEVRVAVPKCTKSNKQVGVDWGAIEISPTIRPLVLVHGLTDSPLNTWGNSRFSWQSKLGSLGIPNRNAELNRNIDSLPDDAKKLGTEVVKAVSSFGSDVDIIAHSKGGLISRWAINNNPYVYSHTKHLITLSTPHHGIGVLSYTTNVTNAIVLTVTKNLNDVSLSQRMTGVLCTRAFSATTQPAELNRCIDNGYTLGAPWVRDNLNYKPIPSGTYTNYTPLSENEWKKPSSVGYASMVGATMDRPIFNLAALLTSGDFEIPGFDKSAALPWVANKRGFGSTSTLSDTYPTTIDVNVQFSQTHAHGDGLDGKHFLLCHGLSKAGS
ncbi:MAG: hypothetical protein HC853_01540 [Anaerolineae bacterium]|nr:hypothetical protein [Anaerolineae bacterium]